MTKIDIKNKAAVLVIDNQTGFFGIKSNKMNVIGERIFKDLLAPYYSEVKVVIAHDRSPKNNAVVAALKQAASKFDTVDMYINMHTNFDDGKIAQVPLDAFLKGLTDTERTHLRFLYTMGCNDGNPVSAIAANLLGFKVFLGHKGASVNPIFSIPFFLNWLGKGVNIKSEAAATYSKLNACVMNAAEGTKNGWKWAIDSLATVLMKTVECMPNMKDFLSRHFSFLMSSMKGADWSDVNKITSYTEFMGVLKKYLKDTEPFATGVDLRSEDALPAQIPLDRKHAAARLVEIFKKIDLADPKIAPFTTSHNIAILMARMGATKELESIAQDKAYGYEKRFIALRGLLEIDVKYYDLYKRVLHELKDAELIRRYQGAITSNVNNIEVLKLIRVDPAMTKDDKVFALGSIIGLGGLDFDALKVIALGKKDFGPKWMAIAKLFEDHYKRALPVLKTIIADAGESGQVRVNMYAKIQKEKLSDDFMDTFYRIIVNNLIVCRSNGSRYCSYDDFINLLKPEVLVKLCRRMIGERDLDPALKTAAAIYLYDKKELNEKDFIKLTGKERAKFPKAYGAQFLKEPWELFRSAK